MAQSPTQQSPFAAYDLQVSTAWSRRALSDGTRLELGNTDQEQGFVATPTATRAIDSTRAGWQVCPDGSQRRATVLNLAAILPNAGGHTHPRGRGGDISGLPGPEDGVMAVRTAKPAYVISDARAMAIDRLADGFHVRVIAGRRLSRDEQAQMRRAVATWNVNRGGSGMQCRFDPD